MPGLFGAVAGRNEGYERLVSNFSAPWKSCESVILAQGVLGGHAFGPGRALHVLGNRQYFAVDGERSLYRNARELAQNRGGELFRWEGEVPVPTLLCKGNVAWVDLERGLWLVVTEWSASFPLYYFHTSGQLIFCSRIGPIARMTGAETDAVGMAQFLRSADSLAGRTPFRGIRRMLPGQALTYDPECDQLRLHETSRAWAGEESRLANPEAAADTTWRSLQAGVERCIGATEPTGVMMSGGWDSRTLLAALEPRVGANRLACYSHGDLRSRELELVERMCRQMAIAFRPESIDDRAYALETLQLGFERVENVVFPHWHRAGSLLAEAGVECVTAGVFGEVLGGHYSQATLLSGAWKMMTVGGTLLGWPGTRSQDVAGGVATIQDLFRVRTAGRPWYLTAGFWNSIPDLVDSINADMEADVQRLAARAGSRDQLIEAFITEHRGAHYIGAQTQSCRVRLDIALPFADQEVFLLASRIPLATKIHNALNRQMLLRHRPELLRHGLAATLLPAGAPIALQEGSRLVRRIWEDARWWVHRKLPAWVDMARLGWVDFEFLRSGKSLNALADDLRCDFWDRGAIRGLIADVVSGKWKDPAHPISDAMMKIYSLDLLLRATSIPGSSH